MKEQDPAIVAGTRIAIRLLTVWMEQDQLTATTYIDAVLNDPNGPGVSSIIAGQLNVGRALVAMLAQADGAMTDDEIMVMARDIIQVLAEELQQ
jgi:hypothetical protein